MVLSDFRGSLVAATIKDATQKDEALCENSALDYYDLVEGAEFAELGFPKLSGMGSVWHILWGTDDFREVHVAAKRPSEKVLEAQGGAEAFLQACENWMRLGLHENIASCYFARICHGMPALFSEWAEHGTLEMQIENLRLHRNPALYQGSKEDVQLRLLDIAIQFARGLLHIHQSGLLHLDVRSSNLLIGENWEAKVCDIGLGHDTQSVPAERSTDIGGWADCVGKMYRYYDEQLPEGLMELLSHPVSDFETIIHELRTIYRNTSGKDYPRPEPIPSAHTGGSVNNYALALRLLGDWKNAEKLWESVERNDPYYAKALFNLLVSRVRREDISAEKAAKLLQAHYAEKDDIRSALFAARMLLESGDWAAADEIDTKLYEIDPDMPCREALVREINLAQDYGESDYQCEYELCRL